MKHTWAIVRLENRRLLTIKHMFRTLQYLLRLKKNFKIFSQNFAKLRIVLMCKPLYVTRQSGETLKVQYQITHFEMTWKC